MADNTFSFANLKTIRDSTNNTKQQLLRLWDTLLQSKVVQEQYITKTITLGTGDDPEGYVVFPRAGTVTAIYSAIDGAITTDDEVITFKDASGDSLGTITVTQSGSAAGDIDSLEPSSNNTFAAGEALEIEVDGASGGARCDLTIVYELT